MMPAVVHSDTDEDVVGNEASAGNGASESSSPPALGVVPENDDADDSLCSDASSDESSFDEELDDVESEEEQQEHDKSEASVESDASSSDSVTRKRSREDLQIPTTASPSKSHRTRGRLFVSDNVTFVYDGDVYSLPKHRLQEAAVAGVFPQWCLEKIVNNQ